MCDQLNGVHLSRGIIRHPFWFRIEKVPFFVTTILWISLNWIFLKFCFLTNVFQRGKYILPYLSIQPHGLISFCWASLTPRGSFFVHLVGVFLLRWFLRNKSCRTIFFQTFPKCSLPNHVSKKTITKDRSPCSKNRYDGPIARHLGL